MRCHFPKESLTDTQMNGTFCSTWKMNYMLRLYLKLNTRYMGTQRESISKASNSNQRIDSKTVRVCVCVYTCVYMCLSICDHVSCKMIPLPPLLNA